MKNFYNIKLLLLVCLMISFGFITSCDNDDESTPNNGVVELLSFGPTGAKHGEKIQFIGHNLDKVESVVMAGATVSKAQFASQSSEMIELVVPATANKGKVTLKVAGGEDIVTKTILNFEVPVTIATVTEEARPGGSATITGTNINWVKGILFEGVLDTVKAFTGVSPTQLSFTVPTNAKTAPITILTGGTEPQAIKSPNNLVVTLPALTTVTPNTIRHSENLTLTGTNLDLVGQIIFPGGTTVSSFVSQTATQLVVKVPNNATNGTLKLVARGSAVEVTTTPAITIALPTITTLTSVKHNENLTISGTNLDLVKEITFQGGTKVTTFVSQTATQLVVKVPVTANNGTLSFKTMQDFVVNPSTALSIVLPAITRVSPNPVSPGANLTITGTNLDMVKTVSFTGANASTFVSQTPTQLVVAIPTAARTGVMKLVTTLDYTVTTATNLEVILPTVTSFNPKPVATRAYLTISGANLDLVKSITFPGNTVVSTFLGQSATQIVVMVPSNATTGKIKFTTLSNLEVEPTLELEIGGAIAPLPALGYAIFEDARRTGWGDWGYGGTRVWDATDKARMGTKSAKMTYTGDYGALRFHAEAGDFSTNGYSEMTFSIFGGPGTNGKSLNLVFNEAYSSPAKNITLVEGEWTTYTFPFSALGNPTTINDILFQSTTWRGDIYVDHVGFR